MNPELSGNYKADISLAVTADVEFVSAVGAKVVVAVAVLGALLFAFVLRQTLVGAEAGPAAGQW